MTGPSIGTDTASSDRSELMVRTRYLIMLEEYDQRIPFSHTCMAAISQWTLLAGYLVIPGTFTSLQKTHSLDHASTTIARTIQNPPLLALSCICFVSGATTMSWLAWRWRFNYVWLSRLFRCVVILDTSSPQVTPLTHRAQSYDLQCTSWITDNLD